MSTRNEKAIAEQLAALRARQAQENQDFLGPAPMASPYGAKRYQPPQAQRPPAPQKPVRRVVAVQVRSADGYLRDCQPMEDSPRWKCGACLHGSVAPYLGESCLLPESTGGIGCGSEVVTAQQNDE